MDDDRPRQLIRQKLGAGRLPRSRARDVRVVLGDGQLCDGCEQPIGPKVQVVWAIQNNKTGLPIQLHEHCFRIWEAERNVLA